MYIRRGNNTASEVTRFVVGKITKIVQICNTEYIFFYGMEVNSFTKRVLIIGLFS